ncbi:MAG: hypothetical protein IPF77_16760 [Gemmatimonadetes bacterium]|nr:hypothetical protein [Gemmatimonadota bacterium]
MSLGKPRPHPPPTVPLQTIVIWLPIALGIIVGTMVRPVTFVGGGGRVAAALMSVVCAGLGAAAAAAWLGASGAWPGWRRLWKVSVTWLLLTVFFRAAWVGLAIGGGWGAVAMDYRAMEGQPLPFMLALIAAAPLLLARHRRRQGRAPT